MLHSDLKIEDEPKNAVDPKNLEDPEHENNQKMKK